MKHTINTDKCVRYFTENEYVALTTRNKRYARSGYMKKINEAFNRAPVIAIGA